jgi:hypothetical protein
LIGWIAWYREGKYPSCSNTLEQVVEYSLENAEKGCLARESVKLKPNFEQALADEGLVGDLSEQPDYQGVRPPGRTSIRFAAVRELDTVLLWSLARIFSMSDPDLSLLRLSTASHNGRVFHSRTR